MLSRLLFFGLILIGSSSFAQGLDTLQLKTIFMEPHLAGTRPNFVAFSPDEKFIYFNWNDSAYSKTKPFQVDVAGKQVKEISRDVNMRNNLSPDGKHRAYTEKGNLWIETLKTGKKQQLTQNTSNEYGATWSKNSKKLAFIRDGDVWVVDLEQPLNIQVTKRKNGEPNYTIRDWADNDTKLILTQFDTSGHTEYYFPEYNGRFVSTGASRRGIAKLTVSVARVDSFTVKQVLSGSFWLRDARGSEVGSLMALDWSDAPMKKRTLKMINLKSWEEKVVFEDSTKGWINFTGGFSGFAPKSSTYFFNSEQSGWDHLYVVENGEKVRQVTKGAFEIPWAAWLDAKSVVYASTEKDPGERHLHVLDIASGTSRALTRTEAFRQNFRLSTSGKYVVYEKTFWNEPTELYLMDVKKPGVEVRLTHSTPERFNTVNWQVPEYKKITSRDGSTSISLTVLKPQTIEAGKRYPVVVFVHGAGSLQNVYKGWSNNYHREYLFHQYLNQKGYVVMEVDYRHSLGYGRKFREDVTNWMGKYETEDIEDGLAWLYEQGYADTSRVGIYGGSYGGFMALYAVSVSPDKFHAAAALRAVTNWENYYWTNPAYTLPRLGDPEVEPEHYKRSSPLSYADTLKRPVLILHGLIDNNVGFQDAVQYIERLIQTQHPDFELMMYPTERHGFTSPNAWYDEYKRIDQFFDKHVKDKK